MGVFKLLRDAKVNLETPNKNGQTPAIIAAERGNVGALKLLRDAKVNHETPNKNCQTPAIVAAERGDVGALELLRDARSITRPLTKMA